MTRIRLVWSAFRSPQTVAFTLASVASLVVATRITLPVTITNTNDTFVAALRTAAYFALCGSLLALARSSTSGRISVQIIGRAVAIYVSIASIAQALTIPAKLNAAVLGLLAATIGSMCGAWAILAVLRSNASEATQADLEVSRDVENLSNKLRQSCILDAFPDETSAEPRVAITDYRVWAFRLAPYFQRSSTMTVAQALYLYHRDHGTRPSRRVTK